MAEQVSFDPIRAVDANGNPVPGAQAYFYITGTNTLEPVYTDATLTIAYLPPLVADAHGVFAPVFHAGDHNLKSIVTDSLGQVLDGYPIDPVRMTSTATTADDIAFTPITGNAAADVQTAVANNTTLATATAASESNSHSIVTTTGSGNAYAISADTSITSYANGQSFLIRFDRANTGAATLNIDGLGAKDLRKWSTAGGVADFAADEVLANEVRTVVYDGTQFVLIVHKSTSVLRGVVRKSTSAENIAGSENDAFPSVAGVKEVVDTFDHILARCSFDGTAGTVTATGAKNIASITDNGAGDYTVNFTTAMADTAYQALVSVQSTSGVAGRFFVGYLKATGSVTIYINDVTGSPVDVADISLVIVG